MRRWLIQTMAPESFAVPDGQLDWFPSFLPAAVADRYFHQLIDATPWQHEHITMYGRRVAVPRLTAWFGEPGSNYTYSGLTMVPEPWTDELAELKSLVEPHARGTTFNSVLLNLYRDGNDSVAWHADDEPELGHDPVIASLSLGQARSFRLKHDRDDSIPPVEIELTHGSLLVMSGALQHHWKHQLPKRRCKDLGPRVNLTFRRIVA
jgi:alkylated DNA repair dioxygenase AlkB